jgi:RNA polymerase sigma-70 factor (ECF subfamily)
MPSGSANRNFDRLAVRLRDRRERADTPMTKTRPFERAEVEALIASQYPGLRLLILSRTRNPALCNDLLQEAVATTWEKWLAGQIARPDQIGGYVFQVAMNLLRNHRRSFAERTDKRVEPDAAESLTAQESADTGLQDGIAERIRVLLEELPERDRFIVKRFYLDEEDKETICREWGGLSALQFDKVIHRARGRLRTLFQQAGFRKSDFFVLALA